MILSKSESRCPKNVGFLLKENCTQKIMMYFAFDAIIEATDKYANFGISMLRNWLCTWMSVVAKTHQRPAGATAINVQCTSNLDPD